MRNFTEYASGHEQQEGRAQNANVRTRLGGTLDGVPVSPSAADRHALPGHAFNGTRDGIPDHGVSRRNA